MPDIENKKPTLKTVAEISGLAVTTVSRALGDAPDISQSTKARVREIADEIGYVPNRAGVRLRTGRTQVISLVLPVENNIFSHGGFLSNSIAEILRGTQYHLNVTHWFPDQESLTPVKHIVSNGLADGIILNTTEENDPRVEYMMDRGFPFATHGRTKWCDNHAYFDYDNIEFTRLAVQQLAKRGRKNIGVILPPKHLYYSQHMRKGGLQGAQETGVNIAFFENLDAYQDFQSTQNAMNQNFDNHPNIDAVIASSAGACMHTIGVIEARGKELGKDIDIYSREATEILSLFRKEILVVREDVNAAGNFVAKALIEAIDNPDNAAMQMLDIPRASDMRIS